MPGDLIAGWAAALHDVDQVVEDVDVIIVGGLQKRGGGSARSACPGPRFSERFWVKPDAALGLEVRIVNLVDQLD